MPPLLILGALKPPSIALGESRDNRVRSFTRHFFFFTPVLFYITVSIPFGFAYLILFLQFMGGPFFSPGLSSSVPVFRSGSPCFMRETCRLVHLCSTQLQLCSVVPVVALDLSVFESLTGPAFV